VAIISQGKSRAVAQARRQLVTRRGAIPLARWMLLSTTPRMTLNCWNSFLVRVAWVGVVIPDSRFRIVGR
jgi:hypothetical protein